MTDDDEAEGGDENAAGVHVDPRIDRIEFVAEEGAGDPPQTFKGKVESASITIDTNADRDTLRSRSPHQLTASGSPTPRGRVPSGAVEVRGGPVDPDRYAARYGSDGGFTDELRHVGRHAGADRLTVVRLPGVRRINAYHLETAPGDLAETVRRLDRQTTADAIATVGLGGHAIVRLTYYREDEPADASDAGEELLFPTGDDDLDRLLVDGDGGEHEDGGSP